MIKKHLLSLIVAVLLLYLSLTNAEKFENMPVPHFKFMDKIVHFGMYFVLMSAILFENRNKIMNLRKIILLSLFPLSYGILMEILQLTLTVSRSGSFYDAVADAAGVIGSVLFWYLIKPELRQSIR